MEKKDKYSYIPMAGETSYSSQSDEIMKRYDKIVYDLFIILCIVLVYLLLCQQWILSVIFGLLLLSAYKETQKEIKEIKKII